MAPADIKPDNLLESAPASGRYKLADFGMCVPLVGEHSPQARGALVRCALISDDSEYSVFTQKHKHRNFRAQYYR